MPSKLVAQLANPNLPDPSWKERIKDQSKAFRYPFKRQNIQQLENKLNQANGTLQLALQALGTYVVFQLPTSLKY